MPKILLRKIGEHLLETRKGAARTDDVYPFNVHANIYDRQRVNLEAGGEVPPPSASGEFRERIYYDGLMSASNGRLTAANFGMTEFRVDKDHVMPEQAVLARMEGLRETSTIYGNGIGVRQTRPNQGIDDSFITVPGATVRWYQPYDTTLSLMHWDVFLSFNNWQGEYADVLKEFAANGRRTEIELACLLDGNYISYSKRFMGENFFHPISPGAPYKTGREAANGPGVQAYSSYSKEVSHKTGHFGGNPKYVFPEAHTAIPVSWHYPQALTKGFNEISLAVRMERIDGEAVYVQNIGTERRSKRVKGRGFFELTAKISMGIRNARVISFL